MFTVSRERILEGLARASKALCQNYLDVTGEQKHNVCDCKYGAHNAMATVRPEAAFKAGLRTGEETGCPEIRLAGYILQKMTAAELKEILAR